MWKIEEKKIWILPRNIPWRLDKDDTNQNWFNIIMRKGLTAIKNIKKEYFSHTKGRDVFFLKFQEGGGGGGN